MQHKLETRHPVLDKEGRVIEAGWGNEAILEYNRDDVRRKDELREWEYYLTLSQDFGFACSIAGTGDWSSRRLSIQIMNFKENYFACETDWVQNEDLMGFAMPTDVNQSITFKGAQSEGYYRREGDSMLLELRRNQILPGKDLIASLRIDIPDIDKMAILVPYRDPELFYYNYKINCMPVAGEVWIGQERFVFNSENALSTYDWGRGIWEPVNQWYWGSFSTMLDGKSFGINIGHGFGDTSKATENMIFYDGVCHKLDQITFQIPGDDIGDLHLTLPAENYLKPWKFVTNDGRLDMDFVPVLDRTSLLQPGEYFAGQHQVFGNFSGTAILDDGTKLPFENVFGFAEKVGNVWL